MTIKLKKQLCHKKKPKFQDYKNCLEATQLENKINQLENKRVNTESLRENRN